jgi:hypothetical protein
MGQEIEVILSPLRGYCLSRSAHGSDSFSTRQKPSAEKDFRFARTDKIAGLLGTLSEDGNAISEWQREISCAMQVGCTRAEMKGIDCAHG